MTKQYSVLHKKLHELESQLNKILFISGDNDLDLHHDHDHDDDDGRDDQIQIYDFEQRLGFFKSLLLAEITSCPTKPHHLEHIFQRLNQLEVAYRDGSKTTTSFDNSSTCSCTESCLNDDGEVQNDNDIDDVYEDPEDITVTNSEGAFNAEDNNKLALVEFGIGRGVLVNGEKTTSFKAVEFSEKKDEERVDDHDVKRLGRSSGFSGGLASGMVLGMALMGFLMVTFSGCFRYGDDQYGNSLTPT